MSDTAVPSWTVRPATMLDVNPVARLLRVGLQPIDIDGDGVADGPGDVDAAAIAARLVLLHVVLERGRLVVVERAGELLAASVWVPPGDALDAVDMRSLLDREIRLPGVTDVASAIGPSEHVRPQLIATMTGVLEHVTADRPHLVLYAVAVSPTLPVEDVVAVARDVVAPVLSEGHDVLALALDEGRARLLEAAGFRERSRIPLGELNTVWVGSHRVLTA